MNTIVRTSFRVRAAAVVVTLAGAAMAAEAQTTFYAANNGVDDSTCGGAAQPCRSITRALARATDGDLIEVGPGQYGDLDRDGSLGGPGEEIGPTSCRCMIHVGKRVTIYSRSGALQTVIDYGNGAVIIDYVVQITASSAVLGGPQKGFTIHGNASVGVRVEADNNVLVIGNTVDMNRYTNGIWLVQGTAHRVESNIVAHNGNGITVASDRSRVTANFAHDNSLRGIIIGKGDRTLVERNISTHNLVGIEVTGTNHLVRRNSLVGNFGVGVVVNGNTINPSTGINILSNNIYGNATSTAAGVAPNCGITKSTYGTEVNARTNFWGTPAGPGADPADAVCNLDESGAIQTQPVATSEITFATGVAGT